MGAAAFTAIWAALLLSGLSQAAAQVPPPQPPGGLLVFPPTNAGLSPRRIVSFGRTHFYQIPERPVGTVVFFHGCARLSNSFFPYHPTALRRGYAVLALTAKNERSQCWSSGGSWRTNDHSQAMTLIANFLLDHKLDNKPLYLHGMSSGATFALKLPRELQARQADLERCAKEGGGAVSAKSERSKTKKARSRRDLLAERRTLAAAPSDEEEGGGEAGGLSSINCKELPDYQFPPVAKMQLILRQLRGIISTVSTPEPSNWNIFQPDNRNLIPGLHLPPIVFVAMSNDTYGAQQAPVHAVLLRRNGIPATSVTAPSQPVTPTWFSDRSPSITPYQSALIVEALKHPSIRMLNPDGWVETDPKQLELQANPRAFGWTLKVQSLLPWLQNESPVFNLDLRRSHVIDALNAAYAKHENVAAYFTASIAWLESQGTADFEALLRLSTVKNLAALTATRVDVPLLTPVRSQ
ncbi:hypothetical protein COHA_006966 [Chlorella ohadii]|uniref:Uncharacterized protein n=1 Tax=Chlorella ohadii TaxID=2649997 RepID=A0AAD5H3B4_9CHLO|nr:hypothetical protein COHA_006966 [Chlorella ohadii]